MNKIAAIAVLTLWGSQAWAIDVRPLKDKPAAQVEQLPLSRPQPNEKMSLMEHLNLTAPPATLSTPTSKTGDVPPLPPTSLPPSGKWGDLPPLPDGSFVSAPSSARNPRPHTPKASKPAKPTPIKPAPTVDYAAQFPQCIANAQQQAQGFPTKLLRNDNRAYSIMVLKDSRQVISCYTDRPNTVENG